MFLFTHSTNSTDFITILSTTLKSTQGCFSKHLKRLYIYTSKNKHHTKPQKRKKIHFISLSG